MKTLSPLLCVAVLLNGGCRHWPPGQPITEPPPPSAHSGLSFAVTFPSETRTEPVTGRILLMLSRSESGEPRLNSNWFNLEPVYAIDVVDLEPGAPVVFSPDDFTDPAALAFPVPMDELPAGTYYAQALIDLDNTRRSFNDGPGNLYSGAVRCEINLGGGQPYQLVANQVIENEETEDTDWVKFVQIESALLTDFHGESISMRASVILPSSYQDNEDESYPVLYRIPGFGGRHTSALHWLRGERGDRWKSGDWPVQMMIVTLDPDVPLGHSVFANSANNGPVGDALVKEMIPEIERRFRAIPEPTARFLTGHSSGGWASLWLQIAYPDFFGGTWSTAPDPVDFRAFQTVNIYEDRNGHWTRDGYPRPVAREGDQIKLTILTENHWEYVVGYGDQLDSFDAVFSPRGDDGNPMPIMNKLTGVIDPAVAEAWKEYDIRLQLEENWESLGPKLRGKLRITGGAWDTFYLESALEYLKEFLDTRDHGGYVEILPGDHGSFMTDEIQDRIHEEIASSFKSRHE